MRVAALLVVLSCIIPCLCAQDSRGAIIGQVKDPSGAGIPGAPVRVTNDSTQVTATTTANEAGFFAVPFLVPGMYTLTAEANGFKKFSRPGIQLRISERVEIHIAMALGTVDETVQVTSDAPLLETAVASLGQVVDQRRVQDLPLFAGNPHELMYISPGIVHASNTMPQLYGPWNGVQMQANGNGSMSNDFSIDGVTNTYPAGVSRGVYPAFSPPNASVSEFKIETAPFDASVGHTIGASINVSTKGGTNEYHGGAHWFLKNSALDAPSFFDNMAGNKPGPYRYNRAGFDIGGPVRLPRYHGKNRTFFFYTFERNIWTVPEPRTDTVPTMKERNGDFSDLLALGSQYQIYDPFSGAAVAGGRIQRLPFAGNLIPAPFHDAVGKSLISYYPQPNLPGSRDGQLNYYTPAIAKQDYWTQLARVDHNFNEANRIFLRVHASSWDEDQLRRLGPDNPASGLMTFSRDKGAALDFVRVFSPSLVFNLRYGATYETKFDHRASRGWDLAGMGFSKTLVSLIDGRYATIPEVNPEGYARISRFWSGDGSNPSLIHSFTGNFTKLMGRHNLKFGTSFRINRTFGNRFPYATSPFFAFTSGFVRGPLDSAAAAPKGQGLATMLMGLPASSSYMELTPSFAMGSHAMGLYLQDDYKLTAKLTVNLGLRWEHDFRLTERYNRLVAQFAGDQANPIQAQAQAAYARNPIAEIAPADFKVLGGLTWVGTSGSARSPFTTGKANFMPRIGWAYQLTSKTVLRGGYGWFYDSVGVTQTVPIQVGYSMTTPIQVSRDGGLTFVTRASDPFPNGLLQPVGPGNGLKTNLGQSLNFYNSARRNPYAQRWSFGFQRLLPLQFVVDASYVGNRGTRLEIPRNINGVPNQYLSTSFARDQARIDYLTQRLPSPFAGTDPIYGSTVARVDLLKPYPHFGNIVYDHNAGYSWYHSLQVRAEKRFSHGFTLQSSYTFSKLMQAIEYLNAGDIMPYETLSNTDRPHLFALTGLVELPFGRGRRLGSGMPGLLDLFVGGWQYGVVFRHQSGPPLEFGDAIFTGDIKDIPLSGSKRSAQRWFNVDAGFNRISAQQRAFNVRAFPLRFGHVRGDAQRRWDMSLQKTFRITEKLKTEFRGDLLNASNTPIFGLPDTNPTSSTFGRVSSLAWSGRQLQFALKVRF
jgi:hypothetical protein